MKYLFSILLFLFVRIISYSQTDNSETISRDKVILNVNAVVNATVNYQNDGTRINEDLNLQLVETVEYNIVSNHGDGRIISLEMLSLKNRMTALGKGSVISHSEGVGENRNDYTFSIDPEVSYPQARPRITAGKPSKIQIFISDFYRDCNGSASGTSRYVSGWDGDGPTYETVPIKKVQTYVSSAVHGIFESPEDMELAMKGEMTALQRKLQGTFTPREDGGFFTSGNVSHSYNYKDEIGMMYNGSVTISWSVQCGDLPKSDSPQITLIGCTELVVGEQAEVTAKAAAEGGSFRFWVEPEEMFSIETTGATAKLMGSSPGSGTLFVKYTSAKGKTTQTSQAAACIKVESYNGGAAIPQIAFYDVNGKKKSGIITVPVTAQPADAAELVTFELTNQGVLSAEGMGSEVTLQGITTGKTTLQAKTKCGTNTGPAVEVEVVNCDDETIARLEKMKKAAIESLVAAAKDLQSIAGSKEFAKARDELVSSYVELLAKVGLTIIANGKSPTKAIGVAAEIADKGAALSEIIASSNAEEMKNNIGKTSSGESFERIVGNQFGDAAKELYGKSLSAIIGLAEVAQAADKFYNNVGQLYHYDEMIEKFQKILEKADKELKNIRSRQQLCEKQTEKPKVQEKPKADQPSQPKEPVPQKKPNPKTDVPIAQEPQTNVSTPSEPSTDDEIMVDPERPVVPPRQVGLPYEPGDCGCENSKEVAVSAAGFSTLASGIQNLGNCVGNFRSSTLTDYQQALQELSEFTDSLTTTLKSDATTFLAKAKESKPRLDAIVNRIKVYDKATNAFMNKMEKCPESLTTGMEIFQSVEKITIDMLKTNY